MKKALRIAFSEVEPIIVPLDANQAVQFAGLFEMAETNPAIRDALWSQLEVALRTEFAQKYPAMAERLAAVPPGSLHPDLSVVDAPDEAS